MMKHFQLLAVVSVLFTLGCAEPADDLSSLEASSPAATLAAERPDIHMPSTFGFPDERSDVSGLPEAARWYCPTSIVTRAQMASFAARTMHGPMSEPALPRSRFSDVLESNVHAAAIHQIANDGISNGCNEGAFCPTHAVTRGQMAMFVTRMMNGPQFEAPAATGDVYVDLPAEHPHADEIEWLASDGLDADCGFGRFCPDEPVTREQIASFVVHAKYGAVPAADGSDPTFHDVAVDNPHRGAIEALQRDGVTIGCQGPVIGYRVEGYPLTTRQQNWLLYFVGRWLPKLRSAYGDAGRARQVAARVMWWSLKRGVFGRFGDPFGYSVCHTSEGLRHLGPFDACEEGRLWEVGPSAVLVPDATDDEIHAALKAIYPGKTADEVALDLVDLGRSVARIGDAGEYPHWGEDRVLNDDYLLRSWLARDPAIGAWAIIDDIERDCVDGWEMKCEAVRSSEGRHFGTTRESARAVQGELERILSELGPR